MKSWYEMPAGAEINLYCPDNNKEKAFSQMLNNLQVSFCQEEDVEEFFASLHLLRYAPVSYLIPDDAMLPPESMRFFYIDENWISAYVDGALSIGRNNSRDREHDSFMFNFLNSHARDCSAAVRSRKLNKPVLTPASNSESSVRSGFLINSQLIRGWPGMEITCFNNKLPLNLLNLTHIGDSILFCIVDGEIDEVELAEPEEGLHFSFEEIDGKPVRRLASLAKGEAGKSLEKFEPIVFRDESFNVLNIEALAKNIEKTLKGIGKQGDYFSSLEFAVQMLHKRTKIRIKPEARS